MVKLSEKNIPTILVIFGATGDLVARKIIPALFHLFVKDRLPTKFRVLGVARREFSDHDFQRRVIELTENHIKKCGRCPGKSRLKEFAALFSYRSGLFEKLADYKSLAKTLKQIDGAWGVCTNKLFYLAVPPQLYETIFKNLAASGLTEPCSPEEGWTRVIVEKPFGKDLKTAQKLDALLGRLFREVQIYRIDHYLAKEMLQNILTFRFSNNLFEINWSNKLIEKIDIKLFEKLGVEDRGSFYDGVGALRDVGQNHLLQMLAFLTMDHPINFNADAIRRKRAEILKTLRIPTLEDVRTSTFRAQYDGYRNIKGVAPNSQTETYFRTRAYLNAPRWRGVPAILESGKRLGEPCKEIVVTFKHPAPCLCPSGAEHYKNKVIIRLEPKEEIDIQFWSKTPGLTMDIEKRSFNFLLRDQKDKTQYTEEYERLILDCIAGDQTLFVSTDEVQAMWRYIDPILAGWWKNVVPLTTYRPDTGEILEKAKKVVGEKVSSLPAMKKEIGIIGLGKMGGNIARQLMEKGWRVVGCNRTRGVTDALAKEGLIPAFSPRELIEKLHSPRIVWLMVPAGKPVDEMLGSITEFLKPRKDVVIDGGNSFYKDTVRRARRLARHGIKFLDVGVSGGPSGARYGATLMIGGEKRDYEKLKGLFSDLAVHQGYGYMGPAGAGHFVKMVHNGIEYGMMQAIAEGFAVMKKAKYKLKLTDISSVYNHGSVIESRLIGWLKDAFELSGEDLKSISGSVAHTGEGAWTVKTAKEQKVEAKIIEEALKFRIASEKNPSYTGRIVSALRGQFGGHAVSNKKKQ